MKIPGTLYVGGGKKMDKAFKDLCQATRLGAPRKDIERLAKALALIERSPEQRRRRERARRSGIPTIPERRAGHHGYKSGRNHNVRTCHP